MKRFFAFLAGLLFLLLLWGLIEPQFVDDERYTVEVPYLPEAWEDKRFAQISDWQIGMWLDNVRTVEKSVERIIDERPAFALISGDFIYDPGDHAEETIRKAVGIARRLPQAGIPTYAVLGNHDYAMKKKDGNPDTQLAQQLAAALDTAGIRVLQNEAVELNWSDGRLRERVLPVDTAAASASPDTARAHGLYLVGIGASWPDRADVEAALDGIAPSTARLIMMHNPNAFKDIRGGAAAMSVAGHTHGGQVRLPLLPDWSYLTYVKSDKVHADGWSEGAFGEGTNRLYVNRGIGFSAFPLRINCMPEITYFTMTPGGASSRAVDTDTLDRSS